MLDIVNDSMVVIHAMFLHYSFKLMFSPDSKQTHFWMIFLSFVQTLSDLCTSAAPHSSVDTDPDQLHDSQPQCCTFTHYIVHSKYRQNPRHWCVIVHLFCIFSSIRVIMSYFFYSIPWNISFVASCQNSRGTYCSHCTEKHVIGIRWKRLRTEMDPNCFP